MSSRQHIRYVTTSDGTRLAWAEAGEGPLLVKAANWLTHLEYEWNSPIWQHWLRFFSTHWRFVRYDERGCGMTEWRGNDLTLDTWVDDLGAVIDDIPIRAGFAWESSRAAWTAATLSGHAGRVRYSLSAGL